MRVNGVVETEKGRERVCVDKYRLAMTMWQEVGGEESPGISLQSRTYILPRE